MKNSLLLAFFGHGDDRLFQWDSPHVMAYEGSFRLSGQILQVFAQNVNFVAGNHSAHGAQILQPYVSCFWQQTCTLLKGLHYMHCIRIAALTSISKFHKLVSYGSNKTRCKHST
jgi:hypothetical protein